MALRTLIIDDTIIWRKLVSDIAGEFADLEIAGTAPNGEIALKKMEQNPVDLVFCDVHMPGLDGVETLKRIRDECPQTLVVMMSGISTRNADVTIRALQMGAIDFIRKPDGRAPEENRERLRKDIASVLRLARIKINTMGIDKRVSGKVQKSAALAGAVTKAPVPRSFAIVAVGVSTGGPEALSKLIPTLPASLPVPVLLVQHMPPSFTRSLSESLDRKSALTVVEAEEHMEVKKGTVYIAPGGRHMTVREKDKKVVIGLNDSPPENSCRPSVDVLFRSVANLYGNRGVLAAVLTGMGSDGAAGVRALKRKGCFCITQEEKSCVVYGMPRAVDEAGMSDLSIPIESIAEIMARKTGSR
ncbi:MAG: chemotaxis-specific protein-glutamate methyltransferase CheB [Chitinivibrionales bacterium]|nr:chemotaxis-specific protein-glutamate methyltransferase CheB [Chitinivibrionales bacterium]